MRRCSGDSQPKHTQIGTPEGAIESYLVHRCTRKPNSIDMASSSLAALTTPVRAGALSKGDFVMLKGKPCKVRPVLACALHAFSNLPIDP